MKLEQFLKIKGNKILLPINEYEFILTRKSAENMVVALRGALKRLTKREPDKNYWSVKLSGSA